MNTAIQLDTLMYAKKLEAAGFNHTQAEALVSVNTEMMIRSTETLVSNLATKDDFFRFEADLRLATKNDLFKLETDLRKEIFSIKDSLTARFSIGVGVIVASLAVLQFVGYWFMHVPIH